MAANPYCYFAPYQENVAAALNALREQEFRLGRYDYALQHASPPSFTFQHAFPPTEAFPTPGAQHPSIEDAVHDAMEGGQGTGSILDIVGVSQEAGLCWASPLSPEALLASFGTLTPTRDEVEAIVWRRGKQPADPQRNQAFWGPIARGEARWVVVYADGAPSELFFAGHSID